MSWSKRNRLLPEERGGREQGEGKMRPAVPRIGVSAGRPFLFFLAGTDRRGGRIRGSWPRTEHDGVWPTAMMGLR